ncbi:hypothetical protein V7S43_011282 [Phytophthora oleae]|uniref:AAA+ ATPase domain-containing protein n=1 Tax=Phytophthora oleae TaxID=2107226 RepID=A0ABD3FAF2_9STRA
MANFLNAEIYKQVQAKFGNEMKLTEAAVANAKDMEKYSDASKLQDEGIKSNLTVLMGNVIQFAYPFAQERTVAFAIAGTAVNNLITQLESKESPSRTQTTAEIEQLKHAFTKTKYVGDAHVKFARYLRRCYKAYARAPNKFKAPYVAVAQSSGFGKSRMILELAVKAMTDKDLNMRVLYMCMRPQNSTGYPKATTSLYQWLFPDEAEESDIVKRLQAIFHYATEYWDTVQTQWLEVFTDTMAAADVAKALEKTRERQEVKKTSNPDHKPSNRLVLVVIDEARNVFSNPSSGLDRFRMLRHALVSANDGVGDEGQIFGVLVDTNSRIADLSPPATLDPSSRRDDDTGSFTLFPPFVLTHTMDANWLQYCRDKLQEVEADAGGGGC